MKYSVIVPVYNRPDEVDELLRSLSAQTYKDMEVIIVEDGSTKPCEDIVRRHAAELRLRYYKKENGGPGPARNCGARHSAADYLIFLDSDCILPQGFLEAVDEELDREACDAWGGPDRAHESFTPLQKAINYSMTSFLTTGGIRGKKKHLGGKFYPRTFNMGIRSSLFRQLGGFSSMRFGEDIDLGLRIYQCGARCRLFPEAWVWHRRRTDFRKFFWQVHSSGRARINLQRRHPGSLKPVHALPAAFTIGTFLCLLTAIVAAPLCAGLCKLALLPLLLFSLLVFIDSSVRNRSMRIGLLSIWASFIQLIGYGTGFLRAWCRDP